MTVVLVTHAGKNLADPMYLGSFILLTNGPLERLLQYADQVLTVLTDGSVDSKQQQPQPLKSRSHDNHNATTSEVRISAPKTKTQPEASDKVKDNRRQLRDPGLWRFYFRAIGWGFTTLFFFISMAYTFFWLMSRRSKSALITLFVTYVRFQRSGSSSGLQQMKPIRTTKQATISACTYCGKPWL